MIRPLPPSLATLALVAASALPALLALPGCGAKSKQFDAEVELRRIDVVRRDASGKPLTVDVELEWSSCPGEQREVIRGDAAFASCLEAHKVGEKVPVRVGWSADGEGAHDWDILRVGRCERPVDPDDETSFDMVHECSPINEHGAVVGFHCERTPRKELLAKCPWFDRH